MKTLKEAVQEKDAVFVDVRTKAEFNRVIFPVQKTFRLMNL